MKKILSCATISLLSVLPAAALNEQMVENAVLRAEALQQRASSGSHSKERFEHFLGLAKIAMMEQRLNPKYLGPALFKSISAVMAAGKKESKTLTPDEERAVYHAVYDLVPGNYRGNMDSKERYDQRFHFGREKSAAFSKTYDEACALVYRAVQEIGINEDGCQVWLWYLNDALVPGVR